MATRIDTVEARSRLKVRPAPYWQRLTAGRHIGFRRMSATTDGTWLCQSYDPEDSKQTRRSLGDFAHLPPSQRYDAAKSEAELWFKHLDHGGKVSAAITVTTACANYVEHLNVEDIPDVGARGSGLTLAGARDWGSVAGIWLLRRAMA